MIDWSKEVHEELYEADGALIVQLRPTAEATTEQLLFSDKKITLESFWNKAGKMIGYALRYKNSPLIHPFVDKCERNFGMINSFMILYTANKPPKVKLSVLFDDPNIRLLGFKSGSQMDYVLLSRWREKQEAKI